MTPSPGRITAINSISLETYLASVISSEMSPDNRVEFLKAHCICSRSWLFNQLGRKDTEQAAGHRADYTGEKLFPGPAVKHTGILMCARMTTASATRAWGGLTPRQNRR